MRASKWTPFTSESCLRRWVSQESGKPDADHVVTVQKSGGAQSGDASADVKADGDRKVALLYVLDSVLKKCKFREESNRCASSVCAVPLWLDLS